MATLENRKFKRHFSRAKVSPKPWNWEKSHEIGCGYPVGASQGDSSPTRLTLSPQVGRELHVQAQQWEYEAGVNEDTGCVIEPRNAYCGGQQDIPRSVARGKPTVSKSRKATVLGTLWRVCGTPPGSKSGACIHRGSSGTWESQCVSLCRIRYRSAARMGKDSRRAEALVPLRRAVCGSTRDTKPDERRKVSGEERENRTTPRWAIGSLSVS